MMGHISTAYAARVSRDLALCSRFDFNVYSYESEWTMGAEWWIRRGLRRNVEQETKEESNSPVILNTIPKTDEVQGVVKARISTNSVSTDTCCSLIWLLMFYHFEQNVSLMWEGRIGQTLISLGVMSDFSNKSKPISALGLELAYFSAD